MPQCQTWALSHELSQSCVRTLCCEWRVQKIKPDDSCSKVYCVCVVYFSGVSLRVNLAVFILSHSWLNFFYSTHTTNSIAKMNLARKHPADHSCVWLCGFEHSAGNVCTFHIRFQEYFLKGIMQIKVDVQMIKLVQSWARTVFSITTHRERLNKEIVIMHIICLFLI